MVATPRDQAAADDEVTGRKLLNAASSQVLLSAGAPFPVDPAAGSVFLADGHDIACRVVEPGDRVAACPVNSSGVGLVGIECVDPHAAANEVIDGPFDVVDHDVENGERRRCVIGLGIDQDAPPPGHLQPQRAAVSPPPATSRPSVSP